MNFGANSHRIRAKFFYDHVFFFLGLSALSNLAISPFSIATGSSSVKASRASLSINSRFLSSGGMEAISSRRSLLRILSALKTSLGPEVWGKGRINILLRQIFFLSWSILKHNVSLINIYIIYYIISRSILLVNLFDLVYDNLRNELKSKYQLSATYKGSYNCFKKL